jgi:hypothetical protein
MSLDLGDLGGGVNLNVFLWLKFFKSILKISIFSCFFLLDYLDFFLLLLESVFQKKELRY